MIALELRMLRPKCLQEGKPMRNKSIHTYRTKELVIKTHRLLEMCIFC